MTRHIRQRREFDCGIATAAMFCSETYRMAQVADPFPDRVNGFTVQDFCDTVFNICDHQCRVSRAHYGKPLSTFKLRRCALLIREAGRDYGHWVWTDGLSIYDPERPRPLPVDRYDRADWLIVRVIT